MSFYARELELQCWRRVPACACLADSPTTRTKQCPLSAIAPHESRATYGNSRLGDRSARPPRTPTAQRTHRNCQSTAVRSRALVAAPRVCSLYLPLALDSTSFFSVNTGTRSVACRRGRAQLVPRNSQPTLARVSPNQPRTSARRVPGYRTGRPGRERFHAWCCWGVVKSSVQGRQGRDSRAMRKDRGPNMKKVVTFRKKLQLNSNCVDLRRIRGAGGGDIFFLLGSGRRAHWRTKGFTVQQLGGVQARAGQMVSDEFVMVIYCLVTFTASGLLFGFKKLLLLDSANSRLSKAAEYVRPIEV